MYAYYRSLGLQDYPSTLQEMRDFTATRSTETIDELWCLQHYPVFTQGYAGKEEHILNPGTIPVVQSDRGGQVTYHGPGQLVVYTLIDLKRTEMKIRDLVTALEQAVIDTLAPYQISGTTKCQAPGVYVDDKKICSLGLRVKRYNSFHGLALNVAMDTTPFQRINPCGFKQLAMTQIRDFVPDITVQQVEPRLIENLCRQLKYDKIVKKVAEEVLCQN